VKFLENVLGNLREIDEKNEEETDEENESVIGEENEKANGEESEEEKGKGEAKRIVPGRTSEGEIEC
jgi:hypothetical protein